MQTWECGNTLLDYKKVLEDETFANIRLQKCENLKIVKAWQKENQEIKNNLELKNILKQILMDLSLILEEKLCKELILAEKSTFNLRQMIDNGKILIISFNKLSQKTTDFITKSLIATLFINGMARNDNLSYNTDGTLSQVYPQNRQYFFIHIKNSEKYILDFYGESLEEVRNYRVGFNLQSFDINNEKVLLNCGNKLVAIS